MPTGNKWVGDWIPGLIVEISGVRGFSADVPGTLLGTPHLATGYIRVLHVWLVRKQQHALLDNKDLRDIRGTSHSQRINLGTP